MPHYIHNHMYYDSIYNHFKKNPNYLILCTHTDIHHYPSFALNYMEFHLIHICISMIHAELRVILFHLHLTLNEILLHSHFSPDYEHIHEHMDMDQ